MATSSFVSHLDPKTKHREITKAAEIAREPATSQNFDPGSRPVARSAMSRRPRPAHGRAHTKFSLHYTGQNFHDPRLLFRRYSHPERQPDYALRNRVSHRQLTACPAVAQPCRGSMQRDVVKNRRDPTALHFGKDRLPVDPWRQQDVIHVRVMPAFDGNDRSTEISGGFQGLKKLMIP